MDELPSTEAGARCAACHAPVRAAARFCSNCGSGLTASAIPPPSAPAVDLSSIEAKVAARWRELKRIGWLFGLLLLSSFVFGVVSRSYPSAWVNVTTSAVDAIVVFGFVISCFRTLAPLLVLPRVDARTASELVLASLGIALVLGGYFALLNYMGVPMIDSVRLYKKADWPVWSMFLLVSVAPAVVEELAFRGLIQSSLEQVGSGLEAWLIQAALFSVLHLSPIIFPSHFVMGLWFGWLRRRTQSVYPGMLMHGLWNGMVLMGNL
jgi:membrane protease YdiL (CAAX protease family)